MAGGRLGERLRRDRFQLGLVLVAAVVAAALLAPSLARFDPLAGDLRNAYLLGPGGPFLLGTDTQGRDVLIRVLYEAGPSLAVGLISQSVSVVLLIAVAAAVKPSRSQVLVLKRAEFVLAARALGALDRRVFLLRVAPWVSFAPGIAIGLAMLQSDG